MNNISTVTWNSEDMLYTKLTNSNKTATVSTTTVLAYARGNVEIKEGKYYWEFSFNAVYQLMVGVCGTLGDHPIKAIFSYDGNKAYPRSKYATSFNASTVIGVALDMDKGEIGFYINGVSYGVAFTDLKSLTSVTPYYGLTSSSISNSVNLKTNLEEFSYDVPEGYRPLDDIIVQKKILFSDRGAFFSGKQTKTLTQFHKVDRERFMEYGHQDLTFDQVYTSKQYILDGSTVQTLTQKPLSIKFE